MDETVKVPRRFTRVPLERLLHEHNVCPLVRILLLDGSKQSDAVDAQRSLVDLMVNRCHTYTRDQLRTRFVAGWKVLSAHGLALESDAPKKVLKFLNVFMRRRARVDSNLLLQAAFLHVHFGLLNEAYELLERFIVIHPFSEDSVLLGYTGYLSFILWRKQCDELSEELADGYQSSYGSINTSQDEGNLNSSHFRNASTYLRQSLHAKDGYTSDLFVSCFVSILILAGDLAGAEENLLKFYEQSPLNPNSCRYLLEFYHVHPPSNPEFLNTLYPKMLKMDPKCEPTLALIPLIESKEALLDTLSSNLQTSSREKNEHKPSFSTAAAASAPKLLRRRNCVNCKSFNLKCNRAFPTCHECAKNEIRCIYRNPCKNCKASKKECDLKGPRCTGCRDANLKCVYMKLSQPATTTAAAKLAAVKERKITSPWIAAVLEIMGILARRLDFVEGDFWTWNKLVHYILEIRSMQEDGDSELWHDRGKWWTQFHAPVGLLPSKDVNDEAYDLAYVKCIGLYLVCGPSPALKSLFPENALSSITSVFPPPVHPKATAHLSSQCDLTPENVFAVSVQIPACLLSAEIASQEQRILLKHSSKNRIRIRPEEALVDLAQGNTTNESVQDEENELVWFSDSDSGEEEDELEFIDELIPSEISTPTKTRRATSAISRKKQKRSDAALVSELSQTFVEDSDGDGGGMNLPQTTRNFVVEKHQRQQQLYDFGYVDGLLESSESEDVDDYEDGLSRPRSIRNMGRRMSMDSIASGYWFDGVEDTPRWGAVPAYEDVVEESEEDEDVSSVDESGDDDEDIEDFDLEAAIAREIEGGHH
ncbi:TATA box-binding protein-associated factor RNA polymerase I subunit A [Chytriomyces hyalinus]|nr:TATA box-binding protein-associated factor RNA polymerase I subunit A [Chytriomyces hyalinus]